MARTILIALVVAIVVGGAAAYGGYKMGDTAGFGRANLVRQQFAQTRQGGQGGGTGGNGGVNRAFELQGTVKSVDGNTMTVTIAQRDVTVTLTDKTQFLKSVAGARTDLTAGARVMVAPEAGAGGAGAGGAGGAGAGGAGGAGAGGAGGAGAGGAGAAINAASVTVLPAQ